MINLQQRAAEISAKMEELRPSHPELTDGQLRILAIRELAKA
jgi:hypothetical protein